MGISTHLFIIKSLIDDLTGDMYQKVALLEK